ncbi:MAG: MFS transporter [Planctomycetaceae bacterium]|nr:MFS transporter [Planctomycetaceae bacterium]
MPDESAAESASVHAPRSAEPHPGEQATIWTLWLVYGAFYFCRQNLSVAVPGMERSPAEGGLGLTGSEVGTILAALKLTYGVGQLFNGQIAEHISPRKLLAVGMFGSALLNVLFGFSTGFYFLLFIWASNGYCQSLGWTPCVRVVGNWVQPHRRGRAIGIIGTGYQVTLGLTFFVAGQAAEYLGWRGALFVPAAILAAAGVVMLICLQDEPRRESHAASSPSFAQGASAKQSALKVLLLTVSNPALWLLGSALGLLNACRYGFVDWGISHLTQVQQIGIDKAALNYVVLALGAVAGSYLTGWATDRYLGGRRAPVIVALLLLLAVLTLVYEQVARVSPLGTVGLLVLIGFCIYGPQVLLVGTAPADLARRGTPAAAAGFVNFLGYMGAALGDKVTGYYKMEEHGGWQIAIYIWAAWALAAAGAMALLWNAAPRSE